MFYLMNNLTFESLLYLIEAHHMLHSNLIFCICKFSGEGKPLIKMFKFTFAPYIITDKLPPTKKNYLRQIPKPSVM